MKFKYSTTISLKQNAYDLVNAAPYLEIYFVKDFTIPGRSGSYNMIATSSWERDTNRLFIAYAEDIDGLFFSDLAFTRYTHLEANRVPEITVIRKLPHKP